MSSSAGDVWEVYALKYAERNNRSRADSFIFDDDHAAASPMDYYVWLLRCGERHILVDTGYDAAEAAARSRPIERDPAAAVAEFGVDPQSIDTIIITHFHYDHAGGAHAFPNATLHFQESEMAYATGCCMLHDVLRMPFSAEHVCEMVRRVYEGRAVFHDGDGQVAPGVTLHRLGGHSRGLQVVKVATQFGPLVLASDATHFYENVLLKKPFPIVADVQDMLIGFDRLIDLSSGATERLVPGHDPLVRQLFPAVENGPEWAWRLDPGANRSPRDLIG